MGTIKVDQVSAYALTTQNKVISVDSVSAYALVSARSAAGFTLDYKQHIANSIKANHNVTLALSDFDLGTPITKVAGRFNAEIQLSVKPSSGFRGSVNLAYTRYPIDDLAYGRNLDTFKFVPGALTTGDMLDAFNAKFGTKVARSEIVDEALNQSGDTYFKASASSVFFEPGSQVNMGVIVPSARDWELVGLDWPTETQLYPLLTQGLDFTSLRTDLNTFSATDVNISAAFADVLANTANALGGHSGFVPGQAATVKGGLRSTRGKLIDLPNAAYPQCDQTGRFDRALVVTTSVASPWFTEPFIFQYNR
jgi:hypothetical protein